MRRQAIRRRPPARRPPLGAPAATPDQPPAPDATPPEQAPAEFKPGIFGKPADQAVSSNDLTIVDGPPAGPLDSSNGGFEQSLWSDAARPDLEDLLGRIPLVSADPFARDLSRRIVLTKSDAPPGAAKRTLIAIRVEKLMQAGLVDEAGALAASVSLDNDADYARVRADALLYAGRDKDVCTLTPARLAQADPFWIELRLWCFAAGGDTASAELTHGVMDAQGIKDPAFDVLAGDVLTGKKTLPPPIDHPTSLHVYLLRKAGLPVHADFAARLGTIANALAARDARNTPANGWRRRRASRRPAHSPLPRYGRSSMRRPSRPTRSPRRRMSWPACRSSPRNRCCAARRRRSRGSARSSTCSSPRWARPAISTACR